jgi:hypothetical protein
MNTKLPSDLESERGYGTQAGYASGLPYDWDEPTPELQWPQSIYVYDRMRRAEGQVAAVRKALRLPILGAKWALDPNGARPDIVSQLSEDLDLPILGSEREHRRARSRGRFSWRRHLEDALLCLDYGHMACEQVYTIDANGMARLSKLAPRMPITYAKVNVAGDGGLISVQQYPNYGPTAAGGYNRGTALGPEIPVDRLVWYSWEKEAANWVGVSIWRPSYRHWLLKDRLLRVDSIKHERNGLGVPIFEAPPNASKGDIDAGNALAQAYRAGEGAGGAIPHGSRLRLVGVEGTLPDTLASINYHDEAIARTALTQFIQLGQTKTGSRALGDSFIDFFKLALDSVASAIADIATQHVVEDLVDLNWGPDEAAPKIVCAPVDIETDLPPDSLVALAAAGVITLDDGIESYTRARYNLPDRTGDTRPVPTSPAVLPQSPILASGGGGGGPKAPTLPRGNEPGPFRLFAAHREQLTAELLVRLAQAHRVLVASIDVPALIASLHTPAVSGPILASVNPTDADVNVATLQAQQALSDALASPAGRILRVVYGDALDSGAAAGQAGALTLIGEASKISVDYDIEFTTALDALRRLGGLNPAAGTVDDWIGQHLGVYARAVGRQLADLMANGGTALDMTSAVADLLDDPGLADVLLSEAVATSLGYGARDLYASEGVALVDFYTAGDSRVDQECDDAQANGPYAPMDAPIPPLHVRCRCALSPADEGIRQLIGFDPLSQLE